MRFYFHVNEDKDIIGTEMGSLAEAKRQAVKLAGALIGEAASTFWNAPSFMMVVTNDVGLIYYTLDLVGLESPTARSLRPGPFSRPS